MGSSGQASQPYKANPKQTILTYLITFTIFALVAYFTFFPLRPALILRRLHRKLPKPFFRLFGRISHAFQPLLVHFSAPADLAVAIRSFSDYSFAQQAALDAKWRSFERMGKRHRRLGQKLGWRGKLEGVEGKLDANARVTDELAALGMERARKEGVPLGLGMRSRFARQDGRVVEVLKHFVRDWSAEGRSERDALFPPILDALKKEFPTRDGPETLDVLVPGCGLARLAYEIASLGFAVEANDFSHFMSLASSLIFNRTHSINQHTVHPYLHSFSHHRTIENMLRPVSFPDVLPPKDLDLHFKPGDFLKLFPEKDSHDAVVTLFFIDTASNLCDYLETIWRVLKPGGIWINEGPLLYYGNPGMALPLEDVIRLAELIGFVIEDRRTLNESKYTADDQGMYSFTYHCEFWVARKPFISLLSPSQTPAISFTSAAVPSQ